MYRPFKKLRLRMVELDYALAASQHAHGPHSDARNQRNPSGEIMHRSAAPEGERPASLAHPQSDRPAAHAGSCAALADLYTISPPDSTKARPTIKSDRLFLLCDGTGHRPAAAIRQDATALSKPVAAPERS